MNDLSVATIDDEPLALRRLAILLRSMPGIRHVGSASSCSEGAALIARVRPDAILLDIRMRDGSGFDLIDQLPDGTVPSVIFVTAFDHFAIRAFEKSAVDYLLKPIEPPRLAVALERARARLLADDAVDRVGELHAVIGNLRARIAEQESSPYEHELWIRNAIGGLARVALKDVRWVSTEEDYVRLHTAAGSHLLRLSIRRLESRIDPEQFIRVHRAALVRVDQIVEIRRTAMGRREVVIRGGERIQAGRVYAKKLRALAAQPLGNPTY
jgi:DNA-binding LytR/AlgR family response regulator